MSTKSRIDRIVEQFKNDTPRDDDISEAQEEEMAQTTAEMIVTSENREFWVFYRALEDVSQADVKELVDPAAETSQSTVSRIIRNKEDAVLHDKDSLRAVHGPFHEDDLNYYPDELIEAHRDLIAEAQADKQALAIISDPGMKTPEWAAKRYPRLVGCHHKIADNYDHEAETVDDSHLNHLESVNTERWK
jgi:hypothetical protein